MTKYHHLNKKMSYKKRAVINEREQLLPIQREIIWDRRYFSPHHHSKTYTLPYIKLDCLQEYFNGEKETYNILRGKIGLQTIQGNNYII